MTDQVFYNDSLQPADQVALSIYDAAFLQGVGLFETMRCYNGRAFRLTDHADKMLSSAQTLGLKIGYGPEDIENAVAQLIQANQLSDALIRITCSSGNTRDLQEEAHGTLLVTAEPMPVDTKDSYDYAVMVVVSPC